MSIEQKHGSVDGLVMKVTDSLKGGGKQKGANEFLQELNGLDKAKFETAKQYRRDELIALLKSLPSNHQGKQLADKIVGKMSAEVKDTPKTEEKKTDPTPTQSNTQAESSIRPTNALVTAVGNNTTLAAIRPAAVAPAPVIAQASAPAAVAPVATNNPTAAQKAQELVKNTNDLTNEDLMILDTPVLLEILSQIAKKQKKSRTDNAAVQDINEILKIRNQTEERKVYVEAIKDTGTALKDAKDADTFITANFSTIEADGQVYYIANKAKSAKAVEFLKKDSSEIRGVFLTKMGSVKVSVGSKDYPAIATRDVILGKYKENENKTSLKNAVAFDGSQYAKVLAELTKIQSSPEATAKGLADKYLKKEITADQMDQILAGGDPGANESRRGLITDLKSAGRFSKVSREDLTKEIATILGGKGAAFVMDQKGIAFDGVSLVPGARIKGKIEGKGEGFYEVQTLSIDKFAAGISDTGGTLKDTLTKMNGKGPIELGGKVFEVKDGQVFTLTKPEGSAFSLADIVPESYGKSDAVRDAIIIALAIKVGGTPHISLGIGSALSSAGSSISSAVSGGSSGGLSLPHISSTAVKILGGFGLGWWIRGLYDGESIRIGENTNLYVDYQKTYRDITGSKDKIVSSTILDKYSHMTWDTESTDPQKQDKSIKIYRPLGAPSMALGHQILVLATKADRTIDADRTIVKKDSEKPTTLQATGNTKNIIDAME